MTSTIRTTRTERPGARRAPLLAALAACCLALPLGASRTAAPFTVLQADAGQHPTARKTMEDALAQVSQILLSDTIEKKDKRKQVQALIEQHVDFETVSKLVLARNWKKFSEAQQKEFVDLFKRHLLITYWKNADYSRFSGIEVTGDRKEVRRDWTVTSVVHSQGADDIRIDYRLRQLGAEGDVDGEWKIIDILVEGVSLVSNFRSQFQSIVSNGGPEQLIDDLRAKVAEAEKAAAEEDGK